jgi:hypothetical protein
MTKGISFSLREEILVPAESAFPPSMAVKDRMRGKKKFLAHSKI